MSSLDRRLVRDALGWDVRNWSTVLAFWEEHLAIDLAGRRALELGCGRNGGLTLWLAARGCQVVCTGWPRIERQPVELHRNYGVANRVSYLAVDARAIPFIEAFDIVCYKSVLGGIGRGKGRAEADKAIDAMFRALKPGGHLLFAENLAATRWHRWLRHRFASGRDGWQYWTVEELIRHHDRFESFAMTTFGFFGALGRREWQRDWLARMDTCILPLIPEKWRYALVAICRKPMVGHRRPDVAAPVPSRETC